MMTITIDPSEISIAYDACQPIGGYGFRSGYWTVIYKGERHYVGYGYRISTYPENSRTRNI